jgi:hypothetical protein
MGHLLMGRCLRVRCGLARTGSLDAGRYIPDPIVYGLAVYGPRRRYTVYALCCMRVRYVRAPLPLYTRSLVRRSAITGAAVYALAQHGLAV